MTAPRSREPAISSSIRFLASSNLPISANVIERLMTRLRWLQAAGFLLVEPRQHLVHGRRTVHPAGPRHRQELVHPLSMTRACGVLRRPVHRLDLVGRREQAGGRGTPREVDEIQADLGVRTSELLLRLGTQCLEALHRLVGLGVEVHDLLPEQSRQLRDLDRRRRGCAPPARPRAPARPGFVRM